MTRLVLTLSAAWMLAGCSESLERPAAAGLIQDHVEVPAEDGGALDREILVAVDPEAQRELAPGPIRSAHQVLAELDQVDALIAAGHLDAASLLLTSLRKELHDGQSAEDDLHRRLPSPIPSQPHEATP